MTSAMQKGSVLQGPQKYAVYGAEMIFDVMKAGKAVSSDLVHLSGVVSLFSRDSRLPLTNEFSEPRTNS